MFFRDKPEELLVRQVAHLQYLFDVPTLEGLLPRMNQAYLSSEEMRNLLAAVKRALGAPLASDAVALAELHRRVGI